MANRKTPHTEIREIGTLRVRAQFRAASFDEKARTVEMVISTEAPVKRFGWDGAFMEILSMDPKAIRLDRLNSGRAPLLNAHNAYELGAVIGVVEKSAAVKGELVGTVRFSQRADVAPIVQDVKDGIIANVSVGYRVHKFVQDDPEDPEDEDEMPVYRAMDWEPFEVSLVPIGADAAAAVRREGEEKHSCEVITQRGAQPQEPQTMKTPAELQAEKEAKEAEEKARAAKAAAESEKTRKEATEAERTRVADIQQAVRAANLDSAVADDLIKQGVTADAARKVILEKLSAAQDATRANGNVAVGEDKAQLARRNGLEAFLLHRADPAKNKLTDEAKPFVGMRLMDLARDCAEAAGHKTRGMGPLQIAALALNMDLRGGMDLSTRAPAMLGVSDFPSITANVLYKTLRQAYEIAPQTFKPIARRVTLNDFKPIQRTQLGEAPALKQVLEDGEITMGAISEGKETYQLLTYARRMALTRQLIINDNMGAFTRLPMLFGRSAADLESNLVWAQIAGNPLMGVDGVALFAAGHNNIVAHGAGATVAAAPTIATMNAARAALRKQKGLDGVQFLNLVPEFLIVPPALETSADQLVSTAMLANLQGSINPFAGRLKVLVEPRIGSGGIALDDTADADTHWIVAASPDQIDILEYAYLAGEDGPFMETRIGFEVDGLEIKCRHDFAAKVIDWRGLFRNAGQ